MSSYRPTFIDIGQAHRFALPSVHAQQREADSSNAPAAVSSHYRTCLRNEDGQTRTAPVRDSPRIRVILDQDWSSCSRDQKQFPAAIRTPSLVRATRSWAGRDDCDGGVRPKPLATIRPQ